MSRFQKICLSVVGSAILAFGLYQIHSQVAVTEGGILGLTLLLHHWFGISPAVSGFVMNGICYLLGWKVLGRSFLLYSALSSSAYSIFYGLFEQYPLLWPRLAQMPLTCALIGAVFVGVGIGFCVCAGGAPGGDDALAMTVSHVSPLSIEQVYLISDLCVLLLSLSYIPVQRIIYSLITVVLSGQIIGWIQRKPKSKKAAAE